MVLGGHQGLKRGSRCREEQRLGARGLNTSRRRGQRALAKCHGKAKPAYSEKEPRDVEIRRPLVTYGDVWGRG